MPTIIASMCNGITGGTQDAFVLFSRCEGCYDTALPASGEGGVSPALRANGYKEPNAVVLKSR